MAFTPTVAVDFDGVIHAYSKGWHDGSIYDDPLPGAFDAIRELQAEGYAVFVHTTRDGRSVAAWLTSHGVPSVADMEPRGCREFWNDTDLVLVTDRKYPAVAYVDDRAIRFESWPQALADLAKFTT